jgi:hypothetical protein
MLAMLVFRSGRNTTSLSTTRRPSNYYYIVENYIVENPFKWMPICLVVVILGMFCGEYFRFVITSSCLYMCLVCGLKLATNRQHGQDTEYGKMLMTMNWLTKSSPSSSSSLDESKDEAVCRILMPVCQYLSNAYTNAVRDHGEDLTNKYCSKEMNAVRKCLANEYELTETTVSCNSNGNGSGKETLVKIVSKNGQGVMVTYKFSEPLSKVCSDNEEKYRFFILDGLSRREIVDVVKI